MERYAIIVRGNRRHVFLSLISKVRVLALRFYSSANDNDRCLHSAIIHIVFYNQANFLFALPLIQPRYLESKGYPSIVFLHIREDTILEAKNYDRPKSSDGRSIKFISLRIETAG